MLERRKVQESWLHFFQVVSWKLENGSSCRGRNQEEVIRSPAWVYTELLTKSKHKSLRTIQEVGAGSCDPGRPQKPCLNMQGWDLESQSPPAVESGEGCEGKQEELLQLHWWQNKDWERCGSSAARGRESSDKGCRTGQGTQCCLCW